LDREEEEEEEEEDEEEEEEEEDEEEATAVIFFSCVPTGHVSREQNPGGCKRSTRRSTSRLQQQPGPARLRGHFSGQEGEKRERGCFSRRNCINSVEVSL